MSEPTAEERYAQTLEALDREPRDTQLLVSAGDLAETLGRKPEAWLYWRRAIKVDPTLGFLVARLRRVAAEDQLKEVDALSRQPRTYRESLRGLWKYPFSGSGSVAIVGGTLLFAVIRITMAMMSMGSGSASNPAIGYIQAGVLGLMAVYLLLYYTQLLRSTAAGSDDPPTWPEITHADDVKGASGEMFCAILAAFWPMTIFNVWFPLLKMMGVLKEYGPLWSWVAQGLAVLGALYFPMALLANVVFRNPTASFRYVFLILSMARTARGYLLCATLSTICAAIPRLATVQFAHPFLRALMEPPLLLIELYAMTMQMRTIGLFYRFHARALNWLE